MKKIVRLTESDLTRIVKRVIEESKNTMGGGIDNSDNNLNKSFDKTKTTYRK